jgi:hypothetical protein
MQAEMPPVLAGVKKDGGVVASALEQAQCW